MISAQRAADAVFAAKGALAAALAGLLCWLSYAAVEVVLTATRVLAAPQASVLFTRESWRSTFELLGLFGCVGLLCGLFVSLRSADAPAGLVGVERRLGLGLTIALGVLAGALASGELSAATIAATVLSASAVALIAFSAGRWARVRRMLANPFCLSVGLLGPPYLAHSVAAGGVPLATAGALAILAAAGIAAERFLLAATADGAWPLRRFAPVVGLGVTLALGSVRLLNPSPPAPRGMISSAGERPNVVLIVWDTVRADHLSPYGYERDTTPFLAQLADRATLYRNASAVADMTLPAHGSLFTGMYPAWHGAFVSPRDVSPRPIAKQATTLAETLSEAGFATAAVAANVGYVSREMGMARGFDTYVSLTEARIFGPGLPHLVRNLLRPLLSAGKANYPFDVTTLTARAVNDVAFRLLDDMAPSGDGFFLFLNYMDAHGPYRSPAPYFDRFPGRLPGHSAEDFRESLVDALSGQRPPSEAEKQHLTALYDGSLSYLDSELERLAEKLEELGVLENTLLVFTSDHGELLGEKELLDHAVGLHHRLLHVPLIVKYPGAGASPAVRRGVSQVDIFPTITDALGLPVPDGVQGVGLQRGDGTQDLFAAHSPSQTVASANPAFRREELSLTRNHWKVVRTAGERPRVYDLSSDPDELQDLYDPGDPATQQLAEDLKKWAKRRPSTMESAPALSSEQEDRLRSLGYIQ